MEPFSNPRPLPPNACGLVPLGGLGEIGKNMLCLECRDQILVVDAGLSFPTEEQPGVDLIIPDMTYLTDRAEQVLAVVLTHGHEDHVGAVPFLLKQIDVPVYGTPMTLGILRNKLEEHGLAETARLREIRAGETLNLGPFDLRFIRCAHSIVDGVGLGIETPAGRILHTGDFKLDPTPVDDQPTDLAAFADFARNGVDLLLADSTNVERPGYTLSEREVGTALDDIMREAPGRVVVACFSSNVHRFQQVVNTAVRYDRKLNVLGRSMVKNMRTAQELGYLAVPEQLWLRDTQWHRLPPDRQVMMTTGSQGEPRSALARAAVGDHPELALGPGDTVVISARVIPGNERRIGNMINHFFRLGCHVHYERVSEIHVSGHAAREELKVIHSLVRPRHFIPVHGEPRHLVLHGQLARELGLAEEAVFVLTNGDRVVMEAGRVRREGRVPSGSVLVDGKGVGDVGHVVLRDRRHLAEDGMVIAVVGVDHHTGEILSGPDLTLRGVTDETEVPALAEGARRALLDALAGLTAEGAGDIPLLQDTVRSALKRYFKHAVKRFPMILPLIMEI